MNNQELSSYIRKCALKNLDSPIKIVEQEHLLLAMNLLVNKCSGQVKIFLLFPRGEANDPILEALNSSSFIKNCKDFLSLKGSKFTIVTNEQKYIRKSSFYEIVSKDFNNINLLAIPKELLAGAFSSSKNNLIIGSSSDLLLGSVVDFKLDYYASYGDVKSHAILNNYLDNAINAVNSSRGEKND
jgi:hypothetical protein